MDCMRHAAKAAMARGELNVLFIKEPLKGFDHCIVIRCIVHYEGSNLLYTVNKSCDMVSFDDIDLFQ